MHSEKVRRYFPIRLAGMSQVLREIGSHDLAEIALERDVWKVVRVDVIRRLGNTCRMERCTGQGG
jgi:hypothetical protein